jgi:hypothetical protein
MGTGTLAIACVTFAIAFAVHWDEGLGVTLLIAAVGVALLVVSLLPARPRGRFRKRMRGGIV